MPFWMTAIGLTLITGIFIARAMLRGRAGSDETDISAAAYDLQVYRDQLTEVERDLARGVLSEEDAERVRTEVSRRILATDAQIQKEAASSDDSKRGAVFAAAISFLVIALGSAALYQSLGNPGYPDLALVERKADAQDNLENRLSQQAFEAQLPDLTPPEIDPDFAALMEQLRATVAERPNDLRGYELLTRNEAIMTNFKAAYVAQQRVIELKGDAASSFDYVQLADLMIRAAQLYVSPKAETALRKALEMDPENGFARYYLGLMLSQNGRPDMTFRIWRDLLEKGPEAAPWIAPIRARIDDLAWFAGVTYSAPSPSLNGPSAEEIEAAEDLSPEDRRAMIESMVSGLAERLGTQGGTPDEWARLIGAYGVLGQTDRAQAIWNEAKTVFAEKLDALATIEQAARGAGLD